METIDDILREMRGDSDHSGMVSFGEDGQVILDGLADRIEAAYTRDVNNLLKIDNACVAQCAVMLDDHIKALVAEVNRRAKNGNG